MSAALVLSTIVVTLIITIALYMKSIYSHWKKRGISYIEPTFPFGNFKNVFLQKVSFVETLSELYNSSTKPIFGAFVAIQPVLIVRDPKIIRDILIKEFSSFYHRGTDPNEKIDPMVNNLLMQNGDKWKQNRNKLTPAFTLGKLKGMFDTIVDCGESLDKHIEQYAKSGETVEIRDVLARFGTNVIASIAFGIDIDSIENPNVDFRQYGQRFFEPVNSIIYLLVMLIIYRLYYQFLIHISFL